MAKVLLVEDDNNLREIYQARLAAEGYEISSAQDGEEALVVAKQTKPDLVVSDVMMPKISGFEMLDILRNTPGLEHVKVIMLTALGQSEDRDRADSLGADKYLVKSQVTLEDIVKTAHELLDDGSTPPPASAAPAAVETTTAAPAPQEMPVATAPEAPLAVEPAPATPATVDTSAPTSTDATSTVSSLPTTDDAPATSPVPDPVTPAADAGPVASSQDAATTASGSTAQEQAVVAEQINNFAQQENPITPEPAAPVQPAVEPAPVADAATSDDQLMADAVNELAGNMGDAPQPAPEPVVPAEPAPTQVPEAETAPAADADTVEEAEKTNISISGKKVIQPLDSKPKPDINELLAREEAGNTPLGQTAGSEAPSVAHQPGQSFAPEQPGGTTPSYEDERPSGSPAPAPNEQKSGGIDPNSVAL